MSVFDSTVKSVETQRHIIDRQEGDGWEGLIVTASSLCTRDTRWQQKWGKTAHIHKLKGYMKLPDRADELLSLALKDYMSEERIIFKDAIWKGPEAKLLLAWAPLIPYSILITCKLKHLHTSLFFSFTVTVNGSRAGINSISEVMLDTTTKT